METNLHFSVEWFIEIVTTFDFQFQLSGLREIIEISRHFLQ